jgi:hypothetical protein
MDKDLLLDARGFISKVLSGFGHVQDDGQEILNGINRALTNPRAAAYRAIDSERDYQNQVWANHTNNGPNALSIGEFILLADEYVTQARQQWSKEPRPERAALNTMRKIAAIAVNCMEQHGAPVRR